jgi:hypothetical protein
MGAAGICDERGGRLVRLGASNQRSSTARNAGVHVTRSSPFIANGSLSTVRSIAFMIVLLVLARPCDARVAENVHSLNR